MIIITIIIILALLSIIFPKSKHISFFILLFIWQLWGWNTWNGDYDNYKDMYETTGIYGVNENSIEIGYHLLSKGFYDLGLSFQSFMIFYSFIVLGLVFFFIIKSPYPATFAIFYILIFIMDYVFIRNYLANSIFFLFLVMSMSNVKYKIFKSVLILLLACTFHTSALVYFLFTLINIERVGVRKLFLMVLVIIAVILTSYNIFLGSIDNRIISSKIEYYNNLNSPIGPSAMHFIVVASILIFVYFNQSNFRNLETRTQKNIVLLTKTNLISLVYIPLYFIMPNFSRFFRVLFTIDLFFILFLIFLSSRLKEKALSVMLLFLICFFTIYELLNSSLQYTYYPLLESNLIYSYP